MTATIEETDEIVDTFLDEEVKKPPVCEARPVKNGFPSPCDNEAKYKITRKCCGFHVLVCEDCLFLAIKGSKGKTFICLKCGGDHPGFHYIVERL